MSTIGARQPIFSIITPVLHEAEIIHGHIAHLKRLSLADSSEIIIVDGDPAGSTTRAIHESPAITLSSPPGRAKQMNAGAARAHGEILIFLHADTELPHDALDKITSVMKNERYVGGAFDLGIRSDTVALKLIARVASFRSRLTCVPYGDQAIFIRREYFHSVGGYRDIALMEDVELMRRIKQHGEKIVILPDRAYSSPRRWEQEGIVYCTVRNWLLITLYYLGVSPERLARYYRFSKQTLRRH